MVIALVALTFVALIAVDALIIQRLAARKAERMVQAQKDAGLVPMLEPQQDTMYHEGHTWLRFTRAVIDVGIDGFTRRLAGGIDRIEAPEPGTRLTRGQPAWTIHFGERSLTMKAPISGTVFEVNQAALTNPEDQAWVVRMLPEKASVEFPDLFSGERFMKWIDVQVSTMLQRMVPGLGAAAADGLNLGEGAAREADEETWQQIRRSFYGIEPKK